MPPSLNDNVYYIKMQGVFQPFAFGAFLLILQYPWDSFSKLDSTTVCASVIVVVEEREREILFGVTLQAAKCIGPVLLSSPFANKFLLLPLHLSPLLCEDKLPIIPIPAPGSTAHTVHWRSPINQLPD